MVIVADISAPAFGQKYTSQTFERPLTIAIHESSYPYHFLDENGNPDGLMVEYWRLWAKRQQVDIEFVSLPWLDTLAQVESGEVDIHGGLSITPNRQEKFVFSGPLFPVHIHLFINIDLANIDNFNELKPYLIGVVDGSAHIEMLKKHYPYLKQKVYNSREALYQAALNKEVLVFTGLDRLSINNPLYQQLREMYPAHKRLRYQYADYGIAIEKNNRNLFTFVNEGIKKITEEERANIKVKWLGNKKSEDSLLISFSPKHPPYSALSPTGNPQGLLIDYWRLWSKQSGLKVEFIAQNTADFPSLEIKQDIDIHLAYPESWSHANNFALTPPIYSPKAKVYVSNRLNDVQSISFFENKASLKQETGTNAIGILQASPFKKQILTKYPNLNINYFSSVNSMLQAAELGQINAIVSTSDIMDFRLAQANLQSGFHLLDSPVFSTNIYSLIGNEKRHLLKSINEGFEEIPLEKLINIENRWLKGTNSYYKSLQGKVTLNKQEEAFILKNDEIKVGVLKSLAPTSFYNEQGVFEGIDRDILNFVNKRTGLSFSYIGFDTWSELYENMSMGKLDLITSITPTVSRKEQFLFTDAYWKTPWVILHPQSMGQLSSLTALHGKELAIVKGYYLIDFIIDLHPQINLKIVNDRQEGLVALQQGKVDGLVETISSASQLLKQESLVNLSISAVDGVPTDQSHIAVQRNNPLLKSILDKGLASITAEEKSDIHEKWFSIGISTGLDKTVVLRVAMQLGLLIVIVLVIFIIWNRHLKAEINYRKELEEKMKHMATHDALTGLANRVLLKDRLNNSIELHQRQSLLLAVLFLDLDGFKDVNDTHGHDVGDELLILVAERLQSCIRKSDTVVRFGGDEFVMLLTGLHHNNEASFVADKVLKLLQAPFELSSISVRIGCSIGIAMYPNDGANDTDLLKEADKLMYQVKDAGKNHYLFKDNSQSAKNNISV